MKVTKCPETVIAAEGVAAHRELEALAHGWRAGALEARTLSALAPSALLEHMLWT
jgi:hypothetical protein